MNRSKDQEFFLSIKKSLYIGAVVFFVLTTLDLYEYYTVGYFVDQELREKYGNDLEVWSSWIMFWSFLMVTLGFTYYTLRAEMPMKLKVGEIMIWWAMALNAGWWALFEVSNSSTLWIPGVFYFLGYVVLLLLAGGCALMKLGSQSPLNPEG